MIELTTTGEFLRHKRKGGAYKDREYALYDFEKK
jgi:hypothetical protein